jgi:hypothetical protein
MAATAPEVVPMTVIRQQKPGVGVVDHSSPVGTGLDRHIVPWVVAPIVGVIGVAAAVLTGILVVRRRQLHRRDATALSMAERHEPARS